MFEPPAGSFFVGYLGDEPVATGRGGVATSRCSAPRAPPRSSGCTSPPAPAAGAGRRLMLAHLERTAAASGAVAMVLETGTKQPEAIALYESSGYSRYPASATTPTRR